MSAMRVGIVVPTFQMGRFLRDAVDSVLAQRWPGLRCVVMDGGSSDDTVDVLRSYGDRIEWVSERDRGQADAIQKGFDRLADCDVIGWLNSDDRLLPGAIEAAMAPFASAPDVVLVHGDVERVDAHGRWFHESTSVDLDYETMRRGRGRVVQPGSLYRRGALVAAGGVDPSFHLLMDADLWIRLLARGRAVRVPGFLAQFRVHEDAKSSARSPLPYYRESLRLALRHERDRIVRATARRCVRIALQHARHLSSGGLHAHQRVPPAPGAPVVARIPRTAGSGAAEAVRALGFVVVDGGDAWDLALTDGSDVRSGELRPLVALGERALKHIPRPGFVVADGRHRPPTVPAHRWAPRTMPRVWQLAARIACGENPASVWMDMQPAESAGAPALPGEDR